MEPFELGIQLSLGPGHADEELDRLTRAVRRDLVGPEVESAELAKAGEAPAGAKGIEFAAVGSLIVRFASPQAVRMVVSKIGDWISRGPDRTAIVVMGDKSAELRGMSKAQLQQVIDYFTESPSPG